MFIFFFCLLIYHPIGEQIVSKSLKVIQMEKKKKGNVKDLLMFLKRLVTESSGYSSQVSLASAIFYLMAKNVPLLNYDWNEWCFQFVSEPVSTGNNK